MISDIKDMSRITSGELPGGSASGRDGSGPERPAGERHTRQPLYEALTGELHR